MSFDVAADSYQRFMGRYADPLARAFAGELDLIAGQRALDVGAGTGALTAVLAERLGAEAVAAVDPSEPFVAALRERVPGADVRLAPAEAIPFPDDAFDAVAAQLVVNFMRDPLLGIREMARVAVPGGIIAVSVWDFEGERAPLSRFWRAARDVDPGAPGEFDALGVRSGQLVELLTRAGLSDVRGGELTVRLGHESFDDWWQPYTLGVGPAGAYLATLGPDQVAAVRHRAEALLPAGPGITESTAWTAFGRA